MRRLLRLEKAAGLALSVAGLVCMAGFVSPGPAVAATGPAAITDPAGDTINRDTNAKLTSAATDIVSASVDSGAAGVVLTFKTQQMGNPATDPNWASPNTFVSWQVDDNGDGKVDDTISYSADRSVPGGIVADNTHWAGNNAPAQHCDAQAAFDPVAGYSLTIAPACMGNPASISYRVQLTYDTNPGATKPPLAFDVAPDQGLAGPVPIAVPTAPAAAPPPGATPAPAAGSAPPPSVPGAAAGGAPAPGAGRAPTAAAAPKPAVKPAPKPAPKPAAPASTQPASSAPAPAAASAGAPASALAATGTNSTRRLGTLGGVLLLLGGLGLMAQPDRRRTT